MSLHFTVLASGSAGNAALLQANGFGLLLDAGLGPRVLSQRLAVVGAAWNQVHAVLLTHTHSDHWKETTLVHLCRRRIPLYCHNSHHDNLLTYSSVFASLRDAGLVNPYEAGEEFTPTTGLRCRPLPLCHDGGATFGFRFEVSGDLFGHHHALGYVADLGSWDAELAEALADVDLLALEFNHDVEMEYASGRSPYLIARVLGERGHLSNEQATGLLREVLRRSSADRLRHVVQLHLSRDCNCPDLAASTAQTLLAEMAPTVQLHTASQYEPYPTLVLGNGNGTAPNRPARPTVRNGRPSRRRGPGQPWLPGLET
jgi:phosphoribosyl 1,2-cyclic phosphodiesterase